MGILNVTPDSFSDGGDYFDTSEAIDHGLALAASGADVIDVGGESTRPGAEPVSEADELDRVVPVVEALARSVGVRISVDTTKAAVARAAAEAGATLINDVSASLHAVAADAGCGWIAMHRQGTSATMQDDPSYEDVVGEVEAFLADRAAAASAIGVEEIWVDPGIGFGKTTVHNLALLAATDRLARVGPPLVIGVSRKRFTAEITARSDASPTGDVAMDQRLEASLAAATFAMDQGAAMVRVHDVRPTVEAARVVAGR